MVKDSCLSRSIPQHSYWTIACKVGPPTGSRNLVTHTERLVSLVNLLGHKGLPVHDFIVVGPEEPVLLQGALWRQREPSVELLRQGRRTLQLLSQAAACKQVVSQVSVPADKC